MKRVVLIACLLVGVVVTASAQRDDLYFVPKKRAKTEAKATPLQDVSEEAEQANPLPEGDSSGVPTLVLEMDEDAYNRRGSYVTEQGDAVSEFAMSDEGFVVITEEGDTLWMNTDTLRLSRVQDGEGWVNGFDGSDSDYEYAMRIIRFRNPRYAIPVSSPLYWDVVYGGALWPSWDWNVYDDGMYAYVFPTSSNWHYWDYMMSYPLGWSAWSDPWAYHHGFHWGHHWGNHYGWQYYGHVWYDPWFNPYFHGYNPGWHHGHHHGHYPHYGAVTPGWTGGSRAYPNDRTSAVASTRRDPQQSTASSRGASTASRTGSTAASSRSGSGERTSSVRVVTGRTGSSSSSAVRTSGSSRSGADDAVMRRSTGSSSVSRSSSSRSSGASSSYSRPSSTRSSSSSSVSRSSSSSGSSRSSYSGSSSGSSRSSYDGGSSSYSGGSSRSSYSGSSSYGGGSSRSSSSSSSSRSGGSRR